MRRHARSPVADTVADAGGVRPVSGRGVTDNHPATASHTAKRQTDQPSDCMASNPTITDAEEGKQVVDQDGNTVGRVVDVADGTAHVDPDPDITDTVMSKLGWGDSDEETYALDSRSIDEVTDDEVRLGSM